MLTTRDWSRRLEFWKSMPTASYALFLTGVFFMFLPVGLLNDISSLGTNPLSRLIADMLFSGGIAVVYFVVARRPRWLPVLFAIHVFAWTQFFAYPRRPPLPTAALQARLAADTRGIIVAIVTSFVLLSRFVQREGARYVRAYTEIALASAIHRLLVPTIGRHIGRFDFRGVSLRSGEVGGDLVDVVESNGHWIGFVADVSGHGVAAGLLMGMVKSAARMQLLAPQPIDRLLNDLNVVLFGLKRPEMFVTFAGLQFDGASELQFSVAGHLPILHYRSATSTLDEVSIPQVPLAMFEDRVFSASRIASAPGDLFVILTDGLTEVFDGQDREFGLDRVKALVSEHATVPLDRLQDVLLAAVRSHGPQLDDQTLLLIRAVA